MEMDRYPSYVDPDAVDAEGALLAAWSLRATRYGEAYGQVVAALVETLSVLPYDYSDGSRHVGRVRYLPCGMLDSSLKDHEGNRVVLPAPAYGPPAQDEAAMAAADRAARVKALRDAFSRMPVEPVIRKQVMRAVGGTPMQLRQAPLPRILRSVQGACAGYGPSAPDEAARVCLGALMRAAGESPFRHPSTTHWNQPPFMHDLVTASWSPVFRSHPAFRKNDQVKCAMCYLGEDVLAELASVLSSGPSDGERLMALMESADRRKSGIMWYAGPDPDYFAVPDGIADGVMDGLEAKDALGHVDATARHEAFDELRGALRSAIYVMASVFAMQRAHDALSSADGPLPGILQKAHVIDPSLSLEPCLWRKAGHACLRARAATSRGFAGMRAVLAASEIEKRDPLAILEAAMDAWLLSPAGLEAFARIGPIQID